MPPKKKSTKKKKKQKKIVEDPKVIRDLIFYAETKDLKHLAETLDDPVFCKLYDFGDKGAAGEALVRACAVGSVEAAQLLLDHKANPNTMQGKALHKAALNQHIHVLHFLINNGCDPNIRSVWAEFSALHFAAQGGNLAVVAALWQLGCALDLPTHPTRSRHENGWTALHFACDRGHLDIVQFLVEHGARVDLPSAAGETACSIAAEHGHTAIVRYLVCNGAAVDARRRGLSLVQWALYRAEADQVAYLMSFGAAPALDDTRVLWLPADAPPIFGQWNFEDHDEEVAAREAMERVERREAAAAAARDRVLAAVKTKVTAEFSSAGFETQQQAGAALAAAISSAVATAGAIYDDPEATVQRETAARNTRNQLLAALPAHEEDKGRGFLTLRDVLRRDFSPAVLQRLMSAVARGEALLRERVAHQQILAMIRWESQPAIDATLLESGAPIEPVVHSFPAQIIHTISSYEM